MYRLNNGVILIKYKSQHDHTKQWCLGKSYMSIVVYSPGPIRINNLLVRMCIIFVIVQKLSSLQNTDWPGSILKEGERFGETSFIDIFYCNDHSYLYIYDHVSCIHHVYHSTCTVHQYRLPYHTHIPSPLNILGMAFTGDINCSNYIDHTYRYICR